MERNQYPLKLQSVCKEIIWGGNRLKSEYGKVADLDKIAESWELTVRHDGMNVIENGEYAGMTLGEYLGDEAEGFPLLIKLIDACDKLSIQVHPDDTYAKEKEGEYGKTEMWYIVDAEPGAKLVYGLKNYSKDTFREAVANGTLEDYMNAVDVKKGDIFFIPSGLVHAIGAGILIAEIQQSSNVTYRVYDYMRRGKDGKLRELHVDKALDVTRLTPSEEENTPCVTADGNGRWERLASCPYFTAERWSLTGSRTVGREDTFVSLVCLEGEGELTWDGGQRTYRKGDSLFIPAGLYAAVSGSAELLCSYI